MQIIEIAQHRHVGTSCKQVLYRRPLSDKMTASNYEDLKESAIVVDEGLNDAWWTDVTESSITEDHRHLTA